MATRPSDRTDLYLSPVALELDRRIAQFEGLSESEIEVRVALVTNREPQTDAARADAVLDTLTHILDVHGWDTGWVPRGLRLKHHDHELVLGIPESLKRYIGTT